jgi:branched-chain amino acid transport system substrate-binding protein
MKKRAGIVAALVALLVAVVASTTGTGTAAVAQSQALNCKSTLRIAFMTPLTGDAGFLGTEQLSWARYAVKTLPKQYGLKVQLLAGDTQLSADLASSLAQKYIADAKVAAIIGPSTSGAVAAVSNALAQAGLVHISPSATRTSLTKGSSRQATNFFFRVVPDDDIQGPADALFMVNKLKVKKVVVVDSQEPYSVGLANAIERTLKAKGVTVQRESVNITTSDFSPIVTKVPGDADVVFFGTQQPPKAQTFAQQLIEQGKKAKLFSGDGANDPDKFKVPGSYVSNFAAPIDLFPYNRAIINGWKADNPGTNLGSFGPPTYGAVQVALNAISRACKAGNGTIKDRKDILRQVKRINVKQWILGGSFRFSTKTNDPLNGQFYIFQIQANGSYKLVAPEIGG